MLKKGLLILASVSVIAACAPAAWSGPTTDPNDSTTYSSGLRLLVSDSASRLNAERLQEADLSGEVAIFTNRPSHTRLVAFYLDDPTMQKRPRHIEYAWPFDFVGTANGGAAQLFDTSQLAGGRHVVTAKAVLTNGAKIVSSSAFHKVGTTPIPTPTAMSTTTQPQPTSASPSTTTASAVSTTTASAAPVTAPATATAKPSLQPTATVAPTTSTVATSTSKPSGPCSAPANTPGGSDGQGGCFPGPDNTGVPAGTNLTPYTGPCTITVANTVIDSKIVNCDLDVRAAGLIVRKSELRGQIENPEGSSYSFRVEDSFIDGSPNGPRAVRTLGSDGFVVVRSEIVGGYGGVYCRLNCTLQDAWVHGTDLDPNSEWHASAVRVEQHATLIHNTLACDWTGPFNNDEIGCSADMSGYPDFAPITHNMMDGNLYVANPVGAGFCAYGGGTANKPYSNDSLNAKYIVFRNNVFQRGSKGKCGTYGPVTDFISTQTGNVWENNRWSDGASVAPG
jgi:hypothetical protein